jgi:hypothetical protein
MISALLYAFYRWIKYIRNRRRDRAPSESAQQEVAPPRDGTTELDSESMEPHELEAPVPGWRVPKRRSQYYSGYYAVPGVAEPPQTAIELGQVYQAPPYNSAVALNQYRDQQAAWAWLSASGGTMERYG